jgi:hypothetical protein
MCVYRVIENKGKPSPPVDEWTLHHLIREGKVKAQTMIHYDGQIFPAAQITTLAPLFHQTTRPLAPYLQPSQAGYAPSNVSTHSARRAGTQVIRILVGVGVLALSFLGLLMLGTGSDLQAWGINKDFATKHRKSPWTAQFSSITSDRIVRASTHSAIVSDPTRHRDPAPIP